MRVRILALISAFLLSPGWILAQEIHNNFIAIENILLTQTTASLNKAEPFTIYDSSVLKVEKRALVDTETHTAFRASYDNKGIVFEFLYDDIALKNPAALITEFAAFVLLTKPTSMWGPDGKIIATKPEFGFFFAGVAKPYLAEVLINLFEGSPTAKARWNEMKIMALQTSEITPSAAKQFGVSETLFADTVKELSAKQNSLNEAAFRHLRTAQKAVHQWRLQTQALEAFEAQPEKLNDLVLNNDRAGVRRMLEAYLPWATMEPVETQTWKVWLEALEFPDKTKTTLGFRGLDFRTDFVQTKKTAQGEVHGFFSTILTQNQGSYTRRLRSLSTNRIKNGDLPPENNLKKPANVAITLQLSTHAGEAISSNFLSFSLNPGVAKTFMRADAVKTIDGKAVQVPQGGFLAVQMDSRRLFPNILGISGESELLAPLIVFPDEVVAYKKGAFSSSDEYRDFVAEVAQKTGRPISANYASVSVALEKTFQKDAYQFFKQTTDIPSRRACGNVFR